MVTAGVENDRSVEKGTVTVSSGPSWTSSSPSTTAAPAPASRVPGWVDARSSVPTVALHTKCRTRPPSWICGSPRTLPSPA